MESLFEKALGISAPWYIESTNFNIENKRLDIRINFRRGSKFSLFDGGDLYPVHDTEEKEWRHLNFFQYECYLKVRVPRVKKDDGKVVLLLPPWAGKLNGFTLLFEALLVELCRHIPVHQVGLMIGVYDKKLWDMLDLYVSQAKLEEVPKEVSVIGMDETSVSKGHDYITMFVDMDERKTVHIAEGKGSDTVDDFANFLKENNADPEQIKKVSCDMSPAFIKGVNEALPKAEITFDKFHILKIINSGVDEVRREEAKINPLLRNTRYIFLKNEDNLTSKQLEKKKELSLPELNLQSMEALRMRETFQQIYLAKNEQSFSSLLHEWIDWVSNSNLKPMIKVAKTVQKHIDGILSWMRTKINNGILEGLNSIVQAAKRKARGYGKKHFITIAFLLTGKLNLNKVNPHLPTHFA